LEWLFQHSTDEWLRMAMSELQIAEEAFRVRNGKQGLAAARRAGGMAINGALTLRPNEVRPSEGLPHGRWGRTYVDHLVALQGDETCPERVREAARTLVVDPRASATGLTVLRSQKTDARVLEAAKDVVAHAYALIVRWRVS
jgi:hypothetical protein